MLSELCQRISIPLVDTTEALIRAEAEDGPQFWNFDICPRPNGYTTIARKIHEGWKVGRKEPVE